jgi:hypothetical protein
VSSREEWRSQGGVGALERERGGRGRESGRARERKERREGWERDRQNPIVEQFQTAAQVCVRLTPLPLHPLPFQLPLLLPVAPLGQRPVCVRSRVCAFVCVYV